MLTTQALWDTGASRSSITPNVVQSLGLIPTTFTDVDHAGGRIENAPVYLVNITLLNRVEVVGVQVTGLQLPPNFDVLIGMDIINTGDFAVTNSGGKTTFSFRVPAKAEIDFVVEDNLANLRSRQPAPSEIKRRQNRRRRK